MQSNSPTALKGLEKRETKSLKRTFITVCSVHVVDCVCFVKITHYLIDLFFIIFATGVSDSIFSPERADLERKRIE